jgi:nucleotidyltransferase/DNA polymerase involved in DNA repair
MPSVTAKRQCPDLIFAKPRFEVSKAVSQRIREIFAEHTPIIEPLSLDEAYLDVTENLQNIPLARDVALATRAKIKEVTGVNEDKGSRGRTVTLKAKFNDFEIITRSRSAPATIPSGEEFERLTIALL